MVINAIIRLRSKGKKIKFKGVDQNDSSNENKRGTKRSRIVFQQ